MKIAIRKHLSSMTITPAVITKAFSFTNAKGLEVVVPVDKYIYVDTSQNVAIVGRDHVDISEDEYRRIDN